MPATIISRCQRFDFRRITIDQIVQKLSSICEFEKIDASNEALILIARHSNGGMRDAENLLEQLSVAFENNVSEESVRNFIGISEDKSTLELTSYILSGSVSEGLNAIHNIATSGEDMRMLKNSLLDFLRATMQRASPSLWAFLATMKTTPSRFYRRQMPGRSMVESLSRPRPGSWALSSFSEYSICRVS